MYFTIWTTGAFQVIILSARFSVHHTDLDVGCENILIKLVGYVFVCLCVAASRESVQKSVSSNSDNTNKPASSMPNHAPQSTLNNRRPGDDGKDFSAAVRDRIAKEFKESGKVNGLEVSLCGSLV